MTKEKTETKRKKERKGSRKAKTKERKKEKKKTGRRKRKSGKRRRKKGRAEKRKREKRREKREIKKIISFIKTCTRLGTLLPQINLSPGSGLSCHKKIFRPAQGLLATKKSPARTDGRFFSNSRQSASGHLITVRRSHISWPFPTSGWL